MAVHFVSLVSPGPNFMVITQTSIRDTRRAGIASAGGVAPASIVWATASLFGLGLIFETAGWLYWSIKVLGGLYLIYLGVKSFIHAKDPLIEKTPAAIKKMSVSATFRQGFLINLSNPKAVVFYSSIFAALLPPSLPFWFKAAALAITSFNAVGWYTLVALLFSTAKAQRVYARHAPSATLTESLGDS